MVAMSRRFFLAGAAALCGSSGALGEDRIGAARARIAEIEARAGGRIGVAVIDTGTRARLAYRGDERFPMCSTFKALAAAAVLQRVDRGKERLDRIVPYGPADLLSYAPVAKAHVSEGGMALGSLCAAAIDFSDNTAGNLILAAIGGPEGFTAFIRSLGDGVTRLDRNEPTLNEATPGDPRDTTSPSAMANDLERVLLGNVLTEASRQKLEAWMIADKVGDKRLRAGLPPTWTIGDKTGSGDHGTANAIAIIRPPDRAALIAAVYCTGSGQPMEALNAIHKEIGALIAATY